MEMETPEVPTGVEQTSPSDAMESMLAGYNKQRGIDQPEAQAEPVTEAIPEAEPAEPPAPQPPSVDDRIAELAAQVGQIRETPTQIAKLHGKIGELNRTIQQLQQAASTSGEVSTDYAKALAEADAVAADFPELAGPLLNVIRAMGNGRQASPQPLPDVKALLAEARIEDAKEVLSDDHPDWQELRDRPTPEYQTWLGTKSEDWRARYFASQNPLYISKQLSEFKAWRDAAQAAQTRKTQRLEGAITPKGEGKPTPSILPDSAGFSAGYNKVRRLRTA